MFVVMSRRLVFLLPLLLAAGMKAPIQSPATSSLDVWVLDMTEGGAPLRIALPDFEPLSPAATAVAAELTRIVRSDLEFASVYRMVDEKLYPAAGPSADRFDYAAWKGAGVDLVMSGNVAITGDGLVSQVRIRAVTAAEVAFGTEYRTTRDGARPLAHRIADEILAKTGLVGVAQTQIAFASDRDGKKSLFRMDYDGERQDRIVDGFLDLAPRWSPDGESLLFVSFPKRSASPVLTVLGNDRPRRALFESDSMLFPGSWSPDGKKVAFSSTRDGNAEIYVMERDGTGLKPLTDHPGIDVSPTWSPTGREIAFTSDRTGSPQIYVMDEDGASLRRVSARGSYNAEPAWSPSSAFNEIAYASRVQGGVFDIVVLDLATRQIRVLTSGKGLNESPSWAPNGRHLVFTATRGGEPQLFTINRDGSNLRQITYEGRNRMPHWGPARN